MKRTRINPLHISKSIFLFLLLLICNFANAQQPGSLDTTFGRPVLQIGDSSRFNSSVLAMIVQPDQKILAAGYFYYYDSIPCNRIARLNVDGSFDTLNFSIGTGFTGGSTRALALQPDGKILVGGDFDHYNNQPRGGIARLNADGTLDSTFTVGFGFNMLGYVFSIVVQPDGKILVGGDFVLYDSVPSNRIIRLNTDGSKDTTFNIGIGFNETVQCIVFDSVNTKILVGGYFTFYNGSLFKGIVQLNLDGAVDTIFDPGIGFSDRVRKMALQPNGQIIAVGDFWDYNGHSRLGIVRINYDGSIDNSFAAGAGFNNRVEEVVIDGSGKLLIGGWFSTYNGTPRNRLCRLTYTGSIDSTFNYVNGMFAPVLAIAFESNGKILCGGSFSTYNFNSRSFILRLNTDGTLDHSTFNIALGFTSTYPLATTSVDAIAVQPDGKILAGGGYDLFNDYMCQGFIRLDALGNIDTTFHVRFANFTILNAIVLDTVHFKIYVGGGFPTFNSVSQNRIARLNWDGTLDSTFHIGSGFNNKVKTILIQPDEKIVVGGLFTSYNGIARNRIARLESNGMLDTSFNVGTGFSDSVNTLAIQPDGKIIAGGRFTSYNGISSHYIARLDTNGAYDTGFVVGTGFSLYLSDIVIQPDGKILAGGSFISYNSTPIAAIARLETTGSLDLTFNTGIATTINVKKIVLQNTGKIVVGGPFNSFAGNAAHNIARINSDGSFDNTFITGNGFNNTVTSLALQPDGKILAGGMFTKYDNYFIKRLTRLDGSMIPVGINETIDDDVFSVFPNPSTGKIKIRLLKTFEEPFSITVSNVLGKRIREFKLKKEISEFQLNEPAGIYFITLRNSKGSSHTQKIILQ